jgi:hypothetical protein
MGLEAHFVIDGLAVPPFLQRLKPEVIKSPCSLTQDKGLVSLNVVAGAGFEPTTYGL